MSKCNSYHTGRCFTYKKAFVFTKMSYKTIEQLYARYPWKTESKFVQLAVRYGFNKQEATKFHKNYVIHDVKVPKAKFMHIYSKQPGGYQMDTFINNKRAGELNFLVIININTRKAYAYPLRGKGKDTVADALSRFISEVPNVKTITSDQDAAYLSNEVLSVIKKHGIRYTTTEDNNHNVLGIINRFMRTIRDAIGENRKIDENEMRDLINMYNESPHKSLQNKAPNDMTNADEARYIATIASDDPYHYQPGDRVRVVAEPSPLGKKRSQVSKEAYVVDSRAGNQFLIKSVDDSVDKYPGYRLVKAAPNVQLAKTIKNGKRGIISEITSFDEKKNKYHVIYEGGAKDFIPARNLREGNPATLSRMEREYWVKQKGPIPNIIRQWI